MWKRRVLALALVASLGACTDYPTRPSRRQPVISAVVVFPTVIGQGDSALVTVIATDPDGDSLRYNWEVDSPLRIQEVPEGTPWLYGTRSNSRLVYRSTAPATVETTWVRCGVWDSQGGSTWRRAPILLRD